MVESAVAPEAHSKYGAPSSQWLEITMASENGTADWDVLDATLQLRGKQATRLGERMILPDVNSSEATWKLDPDRGKYAGL